MMTNNGQGLDTVTIGLLWNRLVSIVDEASAAHKRTAFSSAVREGNDFAASLLDVKGRTLANSEVGLPNFVATQAVTLQHMLTLFPAETLRPGDVLISNDPWTGTGHGLDITLSKPIFHNSRLLAFAGSVAHSPDLGGVQRWDKSIDVFEEAIRIPDMKLFDGGRVNDTLIALIRHNSRMPDLTIGDLEAQLSSLHITSQRVCEMIDEYELTDLDAIATEIYSRSEAAMRAAISQIPNGRYEGELWLDGYPDPGAPGEMETTEPILLRVTVSVEDSNLTVDFSGSSPQRPGPFNGIATNVIAYVAYYLRLILVPFLPNNVGYYRPVTVICPTGTVVNAQYPSATLSRHVIGHQVGDVVSLALAPVIPERVLAASGSSPIWALLLAGQNSTRGSFEQFVGLNGGAGATAMRDGSVVGFPANLSNTPIEIMESTLPIMWDCKQIIPDSGGAGQWRGGVGQRTVCLALEPLTFSVINGRVSRPAPGILGGRSGAPGHVRRGDREFAAGCGGRLGSGVRLIIETPGGGGLGDPLKRDLARVLEDVQEGLVSVNCAAGDYGVPIDPKTLQAHTSSMSSPHLRILNEKPNTNRSE